MRRWKSCKEVKLKIIIIRYYINIIVRSSTQIVGLYKYKIKISEINISILLSNSAIIEFFML